MKKYDASFIYKAVGAIIAVIGLLGCLAAMIKGVAHPIIIGITVSAALLSFIVIGIGIALEHLEDIKTTILETESPKQENTNLTDTQSQSSCNTDKHSENNNTTAL